MANSWGAECGLFGQVLLSFEFAPSHGYQIASHWDREDKLVSPLGDGTKMITKWG